MKLPDTLARTNAELRRRLEAGRSIVLVDVEGQLLADDERGVFLRLTLVFDDGDRFTFDTQEANPVARHCMD